MALSRRLVSASMRTLPMSEPREVDIRGVPSALMVPSPTTKIGSAPAWMASLMLKVGVKVPLTTTAHRAEHV